MIPTTPGTLLGGRVRYAQPAHGFRSGIEPVLLAASIPARPGQRVLEGGSGAGAALLCLAARVRGIEGLGVEIDAELADVAQGNAAANGFAGLRFMAADVTALPPSTGLFDHAFANPPYHRGGTPSPDVSRERAKRVAGAAIEHWIEALGARLTARGTLTLITATAALERCMAGFLAAGCGAAVLFPLWPREATSAKLLLIQAVKGGKGPARVLPGLPLHCAGAAYTREAESVLRDGAAIEL